ncbi:MAG: hypothetical protein ACLUD0_19820 [Eubacterium ramulus]
MIALKITDIGTFINKLLKEGMCDHFLFAGSSHYTGGNLYD